jgi:hypothetical protein
MDFWLPENLQNINAEFKSKKSTATEQIIKNKAHATSTIKIKIYLMPTFDTLVMGGTCLFVYFNLPQDSNGIS